MKKRIVSLLLSLMLLFCCAPALAETWYCPQCGRLNDSNYCPFDGTARTGSYSYSTPSYVVTEGPIYTQYAYNTGITNQKLATRTGPSTKYDEPGTFLSSGARVQVLSKAYDSKNEIWWVQVDMTNNGTRIRAYTGVKRFSSLNLSAIPEEQIIGSCYVSYAITGYYGPSSSYKRISRQIPSGVSCDIYGYAYSDEGDFIQIEFYDSGLGCLRRAWVLEWDVNSLNIYGSY